MLNKNIRKYTEQALAIKETREVWRRTVTTPATPCTGRDENPGKSLLPMHPLAWVATPPPGTKNALPPAQKKPGLGRSGTFFENGCCRIGDYHLSSEETVSFLRPWARRDARTRRPLADAMRSRKPCLFTRLRLEGWNVRFILLYFFDFSD